MNTRTRCSIAASLVVVLMQFAGPDRTNPPETGGAAFDRDLDAILSESCYDCHSHRTRWPWYSRVAPVSWYVVGHVNRAREKLNFSAWSNLPRSERRYKAEAMGKEIEAGRMPLPSYRLLHPASTLTPEERSAVKTWIDSVRSDATHEPARQEGHRP